MTSVAIFVEGQTELIFVEQLLFKMLGYQHLHIERLEQHGSFFYDIGVRGAPPSDARHRVTLNNCSSDGKVLAAIEERAALLRSQHFDRVIGLRDIYPNPTAELKEIYDETIKRLAALPIACEMVIAVREIEAWFLADSSHFTSLDAILTPAFILERLGVNVETQDVEHVQHPAGQLEDIYRLANRSYDKKASEAHSVVNALDYDYLYLEARDRVPMLGRFLDVVDSCFPSA